MDSIKEQNLKFKYSFVFQLLQPPQPAPLPSLYTEVCLLHPLQSLQPKPFP